MLKNLPSWIKTAIKLLVTALALYFVFKKVDSKEVITILKNVHLGYFIAAVVVFNVAKIISIFRFKAFLKYVPMSISDWFNLKIYYIGAFYNLFLPGSVGGDGYKVYLLKQQTEEPTKHLISTALLDRVSGLVALAFLTGVLILIYPGEYDYRQPIRWLSIVGLIACYPAYYLLLQVVFKRFLGAFHITNFISLVSQAVILLSTLLLLYAVGVPDKFLAYLAVFMVSSVVAVVPFTLGGLGARELVFVLSYQYIGLDKDLGVAFSVSFFAVTALSSLVGLVWSLVGGVKEPSS